MAWPTTPKIISTSTFCMVLAFEDASRPAQLANQLRFIAKSGAAAGDIACGQMRL